MKMDQSFIVDQTMTLHHIGCSCHGVFLCTCTMKVERGTIVFIVDERMKKFENGSRSYYVVITEDGHFGHVMKEYFWKFDE